MSEKTSKPMAVTYEDDKLEDPWKKLRETPGVKIQSTARRDP
ncbi:MAG: hypothetical protein NWE89_00920 [Candidatus Bathyarchaeota archaeon]|nr:hypothetical protein [Candidatus Bathyarchaeota archaeon]